MYSCSQTSRPLFGAAMRLGYQDTKKAAAYVKEKLKAHPQFKTVRNKIRQVTYLKAAKRAADEYDARPPLGAQAAAQAGAVIALQGGRLLGITLPVPAKRSKRRSLPNPYAPRLGACTTRFPCTNGGGSTESIFPFPTNTPAARADRPFACCRWASWCRRRGLSARV